MTFDYSTEQREFRGVVRSFFEAKSPESAIRQTMAGEAGYDPRLWALMADQLGVQGLAIPEEYGGAGFSFIETAVVLEEAGRALVCAPLLSSAIATTALLNSEDQVAMKQWLPAIASGDAIAAVALTEESGSWQAETTAAVALPTDDGWALHGTKAYVLDGLAATVILVVAKADDGIGLFAVDGSDARLQRSAMTALDGTRRLARIELRGVPAQRIGNSADGEQRVNELLHVATVALACEQVGIAERVMEMAVDYARQRVQFGRPIGSFQAIKHMCADMMADVEAAKAAAFAGALAVSERSENVAECAAIAGSVCSDVCRRAAHDNIQIHGAIAVTWEYPAQLYFKRAISDELLFGDAAHHRELLARAIGL